MVPCYESYTTHITTRYWYIPQTEAPNPIVRMRLNAPLRRYDLAGVQRRPREFAAVWPLRFLTRDFGPFGPPGRYKKAMKKHTDLTHTATALARV